MLGSHLRKYPRASVGDVYGVRVVTRLLRPDRTSNERVETECLSCHWLSTSYVFNLRKSGGKCAKCPRLNAASPRRHKHREPGSSLATFGFRCLCGKTATLELAASWFDDAVLAALLRGLGWRPFPGHPDFYGCEACCATAADTARPHSRRARQSV